MKIDSIAPFSQIGPLDYFLGLSHVSLIASIFADIFNGNQYVAIATGVGEAGLILSHVYYRKYGMIGKSAEDLKQSEKHLHSDLKGEEDIEVALGTTVGRVARTVEDFQLENSQLTGSLKEEKKNNEWLSKRLADYEACSASLQQTTLVLTAGNTRMETLVKEVQEGNSALVRNEREIDQEERKVDESMAALENVAKTIGGFVNLIRTVEEEFKHNQHTIEELQKQNQELQTEIERLGDLLAAFQKDETGLGETAQKIGQDLQGLEEIKQTLLAEIAHLEKEQTTLHQDVDALKAATNTITRERAALSTGEHDLEEALNRFQLQTGADTNTLRASNAALAEQLKQWGGNDDFSDLAEPLIFDHLS